MKIVPYFSFFKSLLVISVCACLFFVSEVTAVMGAAGECMRLKNEYGNSWVCDCATIDNRDELESCIQQAKDAKNTFINACRNVKQRYSYQHWPQDCNCSQIISSDTLEQCREKADNTVNLVTECESRKTGLEEVWDCNCQEVPRMYYGSVDMGGSIVSGMEEVKVYLQTCTARAEGKSPFAFEYRDKCDGQNDPIQCCDTKKKFYGPSFWPNDCGCLSMGRTIGRLISVGRNTPADAGLELARNRAREQVLKCIQEAEQEAKSECVPSCKEYVTITTQACKSYPPEGPEDYCKKTICVSEGSGLLEKFVEKGPLINFYEIVEETLPRRDCLKESKERFISAYKSKCLKIIKELQSEKQQTLICSKGATRERPGCNDYCKDKSEKRYGDQPTAEQIVKHRINSLLPDGLGL